jgi:hypothetical protein
MLKQISWPSTTTLVLCVVQLAGRLGGVDAFLEGFAMLANSSDSELELELEVELEPDSERDSDSDEEDDDSDEDDDDEEEDEDSLVELSISNPLLLAFLGFCALTTSIKLTLF